MIQFKGMYAKIDLHGYSEIEAKVYLDQMLSTLPKHIIEVTVAHGYRSGNVLQTLVRKKYNNKIVKRKMISTNPGETIYLINK